MCRVLSFISLTLAGLLTGSKEIIAAKQECDSRLNCTEPDAPFCCRYYSAWYSPHYCLSTCAGRTCNGDYECGGPDGECCNTVDKKCTTKNKCLKRCDVDSICSAGTYCCRQTGLDPQICAASCVGKWCNLDNDCGAPGECCTAGGECTKSCSNGIPAWFVAVTIIIGVLCVIGIGIIIAYSIGRPRRRGDLRTPLLN